MSEFPSLVSSFPRPKWASSWRLCAKLEMGLRGATTSVDQLCRSSTCRVSKDVQLTLVQKTTRSIPSYRATQWPLSSRVDNVEHRGTHFTTLSKSRISSTRHGAQPLALVLGVKTSLDHCSHNWASIEHAGLRPCVRFSGGRLRILLDSGARDHWFVCK